MSQTNLKVERVRDYVAKGIAHWDNKRTNAQTLEAQVEATTYQDAYTAIRETVLDDLPEETQSLRASKVQDYLDQAIKHWRERQLRAQTLTEQTQAVRYQSAFQACRSTLLGSMLPLES